MKSCSVLVLSTLLLAQQVAAADPREREDYARLAKACFPMARTDTRARVCSLDTGDVLGIKTVGRGGVGRTREIAEEILQLLAANAVSADELAAHQKGLALSVAQGLFAEKDKEVAGAVIEGADAALKADAARAKIQRRQAQIDAIVFEKLPRVAAELSGPKSNQALLHIHPFYKEFKIASRSPRPGASSAASHSGVQHFLVDLRNDGTKDLHRVTIQLQMRDAEDRIETYLGFWDEIKAGEIVPLCTWKTGQRHTAHFAGCAIPSGSKSHFVRSSAKIWCDEGHSSLPEVEFEHRRFITDLVSHERTAAEAAARKKREAEAKSKAEALLAVKKTPPKAAAEQGEPAPKKKPQPAEEDDEKTERYLEDFSAAGDGPEGWSAIQDKRPLTIIRTDGKAFLTTQTNAASASQSPLLTIRKDFFLEFTVLSTESIADGAGKLEATLEGRDGVKPLAFTIVKNNKGFEFSVTGAEEESRSAPLGGAKPHKVRLERQETAYRILVDGKIVLKHAAGDAPDYDGMRLALANYGLRVYRIQLGPLK